MERNAKPDHESIAKRAHELYLARGREGGHEEEDWLKAEAELTSALNSKRPSPITKKAPSRKGPG